MSKQVAPELPLCCFGRTGHTEHWATKSPNDQRVQTARMLPSLGKMVSVCFFSMDQNFAILLLWSQALPQLLVAAQVQLEMYMLSPGNPVTGDTVTKSP